MALRYNFRLSNNDEVDWSCILNTCETVHESDISKGSNILGGLLVLTLNNCDTPDEISKVSSVPHGFIDYYKPKMLLYSITLWVYSIIVNLFLTEVMGFRIFSHYFTQAYLQIKTMLTHKLYIMPSKEDILVRLLKEKYIFELFRLLYGFCDA